MKYIRRATAFICLVVFAVALVVCLGIGTSIRNVNVTCINYSEGGARACEDAKNKLNSIKGRNYLFLTQKDIKQALSSNDDVALVSYASVFPCTVNVVIKERIDLFAKQSVVGVWKLYDYDGNYYLDSASSVNLLDGSPNIILLDVEDSDLPQIATVCADFADVFHGLRSLIDTITCVTSYEDDYNMIITMRTGVKIEIYGFRNEYKKSMIRSVFNVYSSLTDVQKLTGRICCSGSGVANSVIYRP